MLNIDSFCAGFVAGVLSMLICYWIIIANEREDDQ